MAHEAPQFCAVSEQRRCVLYYWLLSSQKLASRQLIWTVKLSSCQD